LRSGCETAAEIGTKRGLKKKKEEEEEEERRPPVPVKTASQ
jgi:hypothetical protein